MSDNNKAARAQAATEQKNGASAPKPQYETAYNWETQKAYENAWDKKN